MNTRVQIARYLAAVNYDSADEFSIDPAADVFEGDAGIWVQAYILIPNADIDSAMVDDSPRPPG
jgi:hypothetical protein